MSLQSKKRFYHQRRPAVQRWSHPPGSDRGDVCTGMSHRTPRSTLGHQHSTWLGHMDMQDLKSAFLQSKIDEEVFVEQAPGCGIPEAATEMPWLLTSKAKHVLQILKDIRNSTSSVYRSWHSNVKHSQTRVSPSIQTNKGPQADTYCFFPEHLFHGHIHFNHSRPQAPSRVNSSPSHWMKEACHIKDLPAQVHRVKKIGIRNISTVALSVVSINKNNTAQTNHLQPRKNCSAQS